MVQAILGALAGQSSRAREISRPAIPQTALALASVENPKMANKILRAAREDRLYAMLAQPEILGFILLLAGLAISNNIPFSGDEATNIYLQGIATTASVIIACGYAGVGDITSLSLALMAGGGSVFGNILGSSGDIGEWYRYINPLGWLISTVT